MREAMYRQVGVSLNAAGFGLADCYREDRGDGVMVLVPPEIGTEPLLTTVVENLKAELRRYNKAASDLARIRLRVAVHTGEARHDGNGVVGTAVNHAFRILDAQAFKDALNESEASLAVIVSERVYDDVVQHGPGLIDPDDYRPVGVVVKETVGTAWVRVLRTGNPPTVPAPDRDAETTDDGPKPGAQIAERAPSPAPAADGVPQAGGTTPGVATPAAMAPDVVPPGAVFEITNHMCEVPLMATEQGRNQVMGAVRGEISGAVPRHPEARQDVHSIVNTCLDYPGGLHELLTAIKGLAGQSMPVTRLEQTIAQLLPHL
ncbi:hypothetical protein BJF79_29545 [Actinomadura sp. CNU-125]|uniref:effector-associated domain 2-containing protein n=1 Tax=Actinomadura sp. CNU-125 TaxID=1904961 RepID=UPI000968FFCF|nr:hypothetical protein [Actinomadura sp. CNU-125]OLT37380.1 hypothetical protein BJF79_29545 [Actinomadura sp. CNU-125]